MDFKGDLGNESGEGESLTERKEREEYEQAFDDLISKALGSTEALADLLAELPDTVMYTPAWATPQDSEEIDFMFISKLNEPTRYIPVFTRKAFAMVFIDFYGYEIEERDIHAIELKPLLIAADPALSLAINPISEPFIEIPIRGIKDYI